MSRQPRQQLHREVFNCTGCSDFTCVTHTTALSFQQDFEDDWQLWTVRHSLGPKCNCGDAFDPYIRAGGSDHAGNVRCKTCKKIMRGGVIPFFTGTKLPLVALFGILYGTLHGHSQKFIQLASYGRPGSRPPRVPSNAVPCMQDKGTRGHQLPEGEAPSHTSTGASTDSRPRCHPQAASYAARRLKNFFFPSTQNRNI